MSKCRWCEKSIKKQTKILKALTSNQQIFCSVECYNIFEAETQNSRETLEEYIKEEIGD